MKSRTAAPSLWPAETRRSSSHKTSSNRVVTRQKSGCFASLKRAVSEPPHIKWSCSQMLPDRIMQLGAHCSNCLHLGSRVLYHPSHWVTSVSVSGGTCRHAPPALFRRPTLANQPSGGDDVCQRKKGSDAANARAPKIRVRTDGTAGRRRNALNQKDVTLSYPTPRTPTGQPGPAESPRASSARPFPPAWSPSRPEGGRA